MKKPEPERSPDDAETKEVMDHLRDAEKKFRKLIEKRNQINDQAREARDERNALNDQKKALVQEMRNLQGERDRLNAESRAWKDKRNEAQRQAKSLIEGKKKMRKDAGGGYGGRVRQLENEIRRIQKQQETTSMPVAKENELIKVIQEKMKELEEARVQYSEETKLLADVKDVDEKIDQLFKEADEAHAKVVEFSNAAQTLHDQVKPLLDQLRFLDGESDKKHEEYINLRKEADECHQKAMDLRGEVEKLRDKRRDIFKERRAIITDQKHAVHEALFDEARLDEKADEAVKALLSKGKIEL